jgi:hypothetical protein
LRASKQALAVAARAEAARDFSRCNIAALLGAG